MVEIWIFHSNLQLCSLYRQLVVSYVVYCLNIWLCFLTRQLFNINWVVEISELVSFPGKWLMKIWLKIVALLPSQATGWYIHILFIPLIFLFELWPCYLPRKLVDIIWFKSMTMISSEVTGWYIFCFDLSHFSFTFLT